MVSVITSAAAISAVHSLREIDTRFVSSSKRIESGYRVADASDDASIFAVAQGVRAQVKSSAAVSSSLTQGQNTVQVALAGLRQIYDLTNDIRANIILLADGATAESARTIIKNNTLTLLEQIDSARNTSRYNGFSQLEANAQARSFLSDTKGTSITVGTFNAQTELDDLSTAVNNITDSASALTALDAARAFERQVNVTLADFAATGRSLSESHSFVDSLTDALKKGVGALVDTDVAEAMAVRQSAIVQRGLSVASLDFTNGANRRIVNILR
ncbi:flagellin [Ferrovibrio sp.]|uniref:flagellin n=1 Tax=Ferrovibrio sp. TaxID=1917215 RepID=UPI003D12252C